MNNAFDALVAIEKAHKIGESRSLKSHQAVFDDAARGIQFLKNEMRVYLQGIAVSYQNYEMKPCRCGHSFFAHTDMHRCSSCRCNEYEAWHE